MTWLIIATGVILLIVGLQARKIRKEKLNDK